jgi:hypothetical protein
MFVYIILFGLLFVTQNSFKRIQDTFSETFLSKKTHLHWGPNSQKPVRPGVFSRLGGKKSTPPLSLSFSLSLFLILSLSLSLSRVHCSFAKVWEICASSCDIIKTTVKRRGGKLTSLSETRAIPLTFAFLWTKLYSTQQRAQVHRKIE